MYGVTELHRPRSLSEALGLLAAGTARPLAGGTDILVKMRHSNENGVVLVSLDRLEELKGIALLPGGDIAIGAMTTFTQLAENPLIVRHVPMLRTAALSMGGPQIQNVATVGGNICNGAVSADSAPSLFALDAVLELHSADGERRLPISAFYAGPGKVRMLPGELLTRIHLPIGSKKKWAGIYIKLTTRKAMDIAILGSAAVCELEEDSVTVKKAAIALGVAGPTPVRCVQAEEILNGQLPTKELLAKAGKAALLASNPRSSWRAGKEYREALIEELSARAFLQAYQLAGGEAP